MCRWCGYWSLNDDIVGLKAGLYSSCMHRLTFLFALFLFPAIASAHGGRASFEAESGPYLIDIGYDVTGFRPAEEVAFDFDLYREVNGVQAFAPFELIRVEITQGDDLVHEEELENEDSFIPMMKYTFPAEGTYRLDVAYIQSGSVIADAGFDVPVSDSSGAVGRTVNVMTYVIAALLAVFGIGVAVTSFRRSRRS